MCDIGAILPLNCVEVTEISVNQPTKILLNQANQALVNEGAETLENAAPAKYSIISVGPRQSKLLNESGKCQVFVSYRTTKNLLSQLIKNLFALKARLYPKWHTP